MWPSLDNSHCRWSIAAGVAWSSGRSGHSVVGGVTGIVDRGPVVAAGITISCIITMGSAR